MLRKLAEIVLSIPENPLKDYLRKIFYGEVVTERIVEYPVVFSEIKSVPKRGAKVLDIGCYYSNFPISLASMGYKVTGFDLQDYQLTHPNFTFVKGDLNIYDFGKQKFDIITCISTMEHVGIGVYGDNVRKRGDLQAMGVIKRILKKKGVLLMTVPYGVGSVNKSQRVYDKSDLAELLDGFRIEKKIFYTEKKWKWYPAQERVVSKIRSPRRTRAIVFVKAVKK